jgi:4-diphosphocytidyl-2-C-methyl-D-erythritol kinase
LRLVSAVAGRPGDPLLAQLAPALGADVPAALEPQRALVTGAGERVEVLPPPSRRGALVVPAGRHLRTEDVYREFDRLGLGRPSDELDALEAAIRTGSASSAPLSPEFMFNDLQEAAISLLPELAGTLEDVQATGADHVVVSGSGPTVVGLFLGSGGPRLAQSAADHLRGRYPEATGVELASAAFAAAHPVAA